MRFPIPAMLLLSLTGCVEADSATLRFDPETLRALKQDYAQCRAQCRAEGAADPGCAVDDATNAPSCPPQHLACLARCPPVTPPGQTSPVVPSPDRNL